jgi:stearoyl-CoA desaturase (Delta-9 desaturase)
MNNSTADYHDDIIYPSSIPFVLLHLACFAAIWTGITAQAVAICIALYWLRIFAIGSGYHRYFSHRAYATSRAYQFVLALACQTTAQKSVLWWAAKHRHHHLHSDTEADVHSPRHAGFLYSHVGWIFARRHDTVDFVKIADFARYPELMWLHRLEVWPAVALAVLCYFIGGWSGLVVGFCWSTVLVYHATFCINSLAHVHGRKRYVTGDDSRNNWFLAIFTMGEGWHNNHHAYQSSVRQGFKWWEFDPTFYLLRVLSWTGLVWDLKLPPETIVRNEHRLGSRVIERAAAQLAASFNSERIASSIAAALDSTRLLSLQERFTAAQTRATEALAGVHLPTREEIFARAGVHLANLPTREEMFARASEMFVRTPSFDAIVERAHELVLDAVWTRLQPLAVAKA